MTESLVDLHIRLEQEFYDTRPDGYWIPYASWLEMKVQYRENEMRDLGAKLEAWREFGRAADKCGVSDLCPRDWEEKHEAARQTLEAMGEWQ